MNHKERITCQLFKIPMGMKVRIHVTELQIRLAWFQHLQTKLQCVSHQTVAYTPTYVDCVYTSQHATQVISNGGSAIPISHWLSSENYRGILKSSWKSWVNRGVILQNRDFGWYLESRSGNRVCEHIILQRLKSGILLLKNVMHSIFTMTMPNKCTFYQTHR